MEEIDLLKEYLSELREYKEFLKNPDLQMQNYTNMTSSTSENFAHIAQYIPEKSKEEISEELRQRLLQLSRILDKRIVELTEKQYFIHNNKNHDIWVAALNPAFKLQEIGLDYCMNATNVAIKMLEAQGENWEVEKPRTTTTRKEAPTKAFIAHGGETEARNKLQRFLIALGVIPLIIEEEPKEGRSPNEQVEYYLEQADCAIVLGTADDKELKDGKLYPRRNVYIEIGRMQERFPKRIIFLLEEGASFPSDISEKLYTRFTQENMVEALITTVRELKAFGMLKAVKPPK